MKKIADPQALARACADSMWPDDRAAHSARHHPGGGRPRPCRRLVAGARRHGERPRHLPWRLHLRAGRHGLRLCLQQRQRARRRAALRHHLPPPGQARPYADRDRAGACAGRPLGHLRHHGAHRRRHRGCRIPRQFPHAGGEVLRRTSQGGPAMDALPDLAPRPEELEPIERASRDAIAALQLRRLAWSLRHAYDNVAYTRIAFAAAGVHPDDLRSLDDLREIPVHHQGGSAGELSRTACSPCRASGSPASTPPPAPPASRRWWATRKNDLDTWALAVARSIRAAGGRAGHAAAQRLWLRAVHRRARPARRRHPHGGGGHSGVRRHDRAAGAAHPGFRARHHFRHAQLHAGDSRRVPRRRRRPARDQPEGRHLRRRALDQRHAPRNRARLRHACDRHLRAVRSDGPRHRLRMRRDQGRAAYLGGSFLSRDHRPADRRGAARRASSASWCSPR